MVIPIFIRSDFEFPEITKFTIMENIWVCLVVLAALVIVAGGILMLFTESLGFEIFCGGLMGGFVMNMIMLLLCCSKYNTE